MSASNKLIFSLEQNLDIDEKNQARNNIGAVGAFRQTVQTETVTLSNDQAQNGVIEVATKFNSGHYIMNVELYIATGSNVSDSRVPVRLTFSYNNGGSTNDTMWTSALERFNNSAPWYAGLTMADAYVGPMLTSRKLRINWEPWKIQAGVSIQVTISYLLISETEPS